MFNKNKLLSLKAIFNLCRNQFLVKRELIIYLEITDSYLFVENGCVAKNRKNAIKLNY